MSIGRGGSIPPLHTTCKNAKLTKMETLQIREIEESQDFNSNTLFQEIPFTQMPFYGTWQEALGRKVRSFVIEDGEPVAYFQIVKYPLIGSRSYLYIPYGPMVKEYSDELLLFIKKELKRIAKEEQAVFVRVDFTPASEDIAKFFKKAPGYTYHSAYFQPRLEWVLDLEGSEEEMLMARKKKTRYSIRLGEHEGIKIEFVEENFKDYFEDFYRLMSETAERNGFSLHVKDYYKSIFENLKSEYAYLVLAKDGDKVLVVNLIIISGQTANYVFGASSREEDKKMPAYLAQWKSIMKAKERGCRVYSFGGVSDKEGKYHGWEGLTLFKKKFGGRELKHGDFFDLVVNPFWYNLYNFRKLLKSLISW